MPFAFHPFHRLAVQCSMTYNAVPYQSQGRMKSLLYRRRLSDDLPKRPGETLSLTITLPTEQHMEIPLSGRPMVTSLP